MVVGERAGALLEGRCPSAARHPPRREPGWIFFGAEFLALDPPEGGREASVI